MNLNQTIHLNIEWKLLSAESNPLQPNGLIKTLKSLVNDINNGKYTQIGIIWDLDVLTIEERVKMIKLAINSAYPLAYIVDFNSINEFGSITFN